MKIDKLTGEQRSLFSVYREEGLRIGLSTETTDRRSAEKWIDEVYKIRGLDPPKIKIWLRSPLRGCIGSFLIKRIKIKDKLKIEPMKNEVMNEVRDEVLKEVRDEVLKEVGNEVGNEVLKEVGNEVWNEVWNEVLKEVGNEVRDEVLKEMGNEVWNELHRCGYGLHDSPWLSFYNYFLNVCKLSFCEKLKPLMELSKHCGLWWPFKGVVVLTEKPSFICRDEQHRLHHESRKALKYSDGWGLYRWHGVRVPGWVIKRPQDITIEKINEEKNAEVRRVLLERFGVARWLKELGAVIVNKDRYGELVETVSLAKWEGEDPMAKFVIVKDSSTDRVYALRVPPNIQTAHEGVAATFGKTTEQYQPIQET